MILVNCSTNQDAEPEDDTLPSDSSLFSWGTTVVISTESIWNHREGIKRSLQTPTDPSTQPHSLAIRRPDEPPHSSPRVASRFFPKCVAGPYEGRSISGTQNHCWKVYSDRSPEVLSRDDFAHYHHTSVESGHGSNQDPGSFSSGCCRTHPPSLTRTSPLRRPRLFPNPMATLPQLSNPPHPLSFDACLSHTFLS